MMYPFLNSRRHLTHLFSTTFFVLSCSCHYYTYEIVFILSSQKKLQLLHGENCRNKCRTSTTHALTQLIPLTQSPFRNLFPHFSQFKENSQRGGRSEILSELSDQSEDLTTALLEDEYQFTGEKEFLPSIVCHMLEDGDERISGYGNVFTERSQYSKKM